jgi:hypothetical protein
MKAFSSLCKFITFFIVESLILAGFYWFFGNLPTERVFFVIESIFKAAFKVWHGCDLSLVFVGKSFVFKQFS